MRRSLVMALAAGIVAVMFFVSTSHVSRARQQRDAIQAIGQVGGRFYYDYAKDTNGVWGSGRSEVPATLKRLFECVLGTDWRNWVYDVGYIYLEGDRVSDDTLAKVSKLDRVEVMVLWDNNTVTESGWSDIGGMTSLTLLSLQHSCLDDIGMGHLTGLKKLTKLELNNTLISDVSLPFLKTFPKIEELWISDTRISKAEGRKIEASFPNGVVDY